MASRLKSRAQNEKQRHKPTQTMQGKLAVFEKELSAGYFHVKTTVVAPQVTEYPLIEHHRSPSLSSYYLMISHPQGPESEQRNVGGGGDWQKSFAFCIQLKPLGFFFFLSRGALI